MKKSKWTGFAMNNLSNTQVSGQENGRAPAQDEQTKPSQSAAEKKSKDPGTNSKIKETNSKDEETNSKVVVTKAQDTETKSKDTGTKPKDTGTKPKDTGTKPKDTGTNPKDTGTKSKDTGTKPKDIKAKSTGNGTMSSDILSKLEAKEEATKTKVTELLERKMNAGIPQETETKEIRGKEKKNLETPIKKFPKLSTWSQKKKQKEEIKVKLALDRRRRELMKEAIESQRAKGIIPPSSKKKAETHTGANTEIKGLKTTLMEKMKKSEKKPHTASKNTKIAPNILKKSNEGETQNGSPKKQVRFTQDSKVVSIHEKPKIEKKTMADHRRDLENRKRELDEKERRKKKVDQTKLNQQLAERRVIEQFVSDPDADLIEMLMNVNSPLVAQLDEKQSLNRERNRTTSTTSSTSSPSTKSSAKKKQQPYGTVPERTGPSDLYSKPPRNLTVDRGLDDLDDFSDEEMNPLTEPIYSGSQRSYMETKGWDVFRNLPPGQDSGSEAMNQRCLGIIIRSLKVFTYILSFAIVLAGSVIGKGTLFFMTSQIRPRKTVLHCNRELERDKQYQAEISSAEQVAWIWCLFVVFILPELGTLFRSSRICIFKSARKCTFSDFMVVWVFETMHIIGLALLVFVVFPELDVVKGAMLTNCVAFIPAVLGLASRNSKESRRFLKVTMDLIAIGGQATGFIIWPIVEIGNGNTKAWTVPVAIFLVSAGWWENFVDRRSPIGPVKELGRLKDRLKKTRYFTYSFISIWKMILFFACMLLFLHFNGTNILNLFTEFNTAFHAHPINVTQVHSTGLGHGANLPDIPGSQLLQEIIEIRSYASTPLCVLLIQISSAYMAYIFGKFACKICIQAFSFAFPVILSVPVTVTLLITACGLRNEDSCWFRETVPDYLYFECPGGDFLNDFISNQHAWIWIIWLLSQTWIALHIWIPQCERLAPTEKLFVTPMYSGFLIDQSLALNRRRDGEGEVKTEELELDRVGLDENDISQYYETISVHTEGSNTNLTKTKTSDSITRIYACATMWHETRSETMEMMKSIFRMDEDQSARRVAQKYLKVVDADYYEFETHIFFDDAFEISDVCDDWMQVNQFVRLFIGCVDEAASYVHQTNIRLRPPKKVPTPYGGRLVYTLPGKTKMIVHMKDKSKIRHKKRWSQCMYMYYLLGHRLMELPIAVDRKDRLAENTYLLTLDGDIDFQPPAVSLLVDLMKKNKNLGAACGRIHPVGSGPMVWYQLFEYAIGHWLQKATEHMIGCVMCSPGCFSLFRAKALMDDNVMKRYTTTSEEPRHYVQYDQGEDRWLCTLLLQRGYRVEYSAASDAYTHCPEGFNEFFNQRRRWVPSTIANIFDLLMDYKHTVKINDNISLPYIWYQVMLMSGTIIGPGTIFLMLVGAFVAAFKISNWISFYYNLIPIVVYTVCCMTCKSSWQLLLSGLLSTFYALVMMAVIVGTALQLGEDGVGSPSAIFLISMVGSFFIAAVLHPQEFWCIVPGIIYLLCIPSMYLLLIIYSITNLNVVSWGTREVAVKKTKKEMEEERNNAKNSEKKAKKEGLWGLLYNAGDNNDDEEGGIDFSIGNVIRLMLFTHKKETHEREQLLRIADSLDTLTKRLDHIEGVLDPHAAKKQRRKSSRMSAHGDILHNLSEGGEMNLDVDSEDEESHTTEPREERDDLINPFWLEDKDLGRGEVDYLSGVEIQFWKDLLDKYLHPLDADKQKQALITQGLKELRNKSVFFFSVFNALFVLIVFMLTLHKDTLHINWPLGIRENITITEDEQVIITKEYLHLEPIGIVLVFFFFAIILIQFTAMLFHRFGTISHILASTELNCCVKKEDVLSDEALIEKNAVEIVKQMQKLRGIGGEYESESSSSNRLAHRRTIHMLEKNRQKKRAIGTLDVAFKKRFFALSNQDQEQDHEGKQGQQTPILGSRMPMRRETLKALEHRRDDVMSERKQSKMQTLGASNPYNNNKDKHRGAVKLTGDTVDRIFANGGVDNTGFDASAPNSSNTDDESSSIRNSTNRASQRAQTIAFRDPLMSRMDRSSSDRLSTSGTSKM